MSTLDVSTAPGARAVIAAAQALAPLGGVFHLATVFRDKWLSSQARSASAPLLQWHAWQGSAWRSQTACPACMCTAPCMHADADGMDSVHQNERGAGGWLMDTLMSAAGRLPIQL